MTNPKYPPMTTLNFLLEEHRKFTSEEDQAIVAALEEAIKALKLEGEMEAERDRLLAAVKAASMDMHHPSMRPCATCRAVSEALGNSWGCYEYQKKRIAQNQGGQP